jgi:conjugative relaxase-like TrwC/TraI family protein
MLTIRAMSDGKGYASRHLEHRDYYAEGERVVGHWYGKGAQLLGLEGEVRSKDFESLRQGLDPGSGEFLRPRQSADRVGPDGTTQSYARSLYDFTISAPKSVSIMAILGGDGRLIEAHEKAVAATLQELEAHAAARVRQAALNEDRPTANLVVAVYHHDTSRELDPQLHTHAVAANLTYDGTEGRWKALQASGIYKRRAYLTEVYRHALAHEVRALGYDIENRRDSKGRDAGFEIRGVSDDLLAKYSQRSRQRDQAIQEFTKKAGRLPTDNEIAVLVRESRADKLIEISTTEVRNRQRDRLTAEEARLLVESRPPQRRSSLDGLESGAHSLQYAIDHIFERVSVAPDFEVLAEALRHGRGQVDYEKLKGALALMESSAAILREGNDIATAESLQRERKMIDAIDRGADQFDRLGRKDRFAAAEHLRSEQKQAIEFVLDSHDLAVNLRGAAGTGKTAALQELRQGLLGAERHVVAIAPTVSAVEELQKVGFADAVTLEGLLQNGGPDLNHKVVIVDEAGMISSRQMWDLLSLAKQRSLRLVFSGDTSQIQSVEAGDALRILEKESRLKSTALTEVQRQKPRDYREAIQELRTNPELGFDKLEAIGAVREVAWLDRPNAIARAYMESDTKRLLAVCATHDEIDRVTDAIRLARKEARELGAGVSVTRHVSLNWTTAQKSDLRNFSGGQILTFHRAVQGIGKNETVEVMDVEHKRLLVRNAKGEIRRITSRHVKAFDVVVAKTVEVAASDKLLFTANHRTSGFCATNGEIVTVSRVEGNGRIHLEDGRVIPDNYRNFAHGYAVTAHRSQGKSVDSVIISADGMTKELFYVGASRGRESVQVFTTDKEQLRCSVAQSNARRSASELAAKIRAGLHQGIRRSRAPGCELAMHQVEQQLPGVRRQPIEQSRKETRNVPGISR